MKEELNTYAYSRPRVRVFRTWYEATRPLRERNGMKWLQFFDAVFAYALGSSGHPTFEDGELAQLWQRTKIKPYTPCKIGYIKLSKNGGKHYE